MASAKNFGFVRLLAPAGIGSAQETGVAYTDPASRSFANTFAVPPIVKAVDGCWYSCGPGDPPRAGEGRTRYIPMIPALQI